jgi:hypothetical protein
VLPAMVGSSVDGNDDDEERADEVSGGDGEQQDAVLADIQEGIGNLLVIEEEKAEDVKVAEVQVEDVKVAEVQVKEELVESAAAGDMGSSKSRKKKNKKKSK